MTKAQTKIKVTPQKYVLMDGDEISLIFNDTSTTEILCVSSDTWGWDAFETVERVKLGKIKLFKIEEVKLEVTEPSIKIIG